MHWQTMDLMIAIEKENKSDVLPELHALINKNHMARDTYDVYSKHFPIASQAVCAYGIAEAMEAERLLED